MGGICSRSLNIEFPFSDSNGQVLKNSDGTGNKTVVAPPQVIGIEEETEKVDSEESRRRRHGNMASASDNNEEFYDGIPRYPRALSQKSRSVRLAKVSEVSLRLGRAGTAGLGKAVEVLDTLGSSMTNFNTSNGFGSTTPTKGNEIAILAFEIANTIVKGSNLMQSLSEGSVSQLKEELFPSEAVQRLVSNDTHQLLRIVAADKREELKLFSGEVVRFGNRSKDPQWHNLERYFEKISKGVGPQRDLKDEADLVIVQLMTLVQNTAELYHELHALDRFEQDFHRKRLESEISTASQKGDSISIMRSELKAQKKLVKSIKKKSLWSKSLEEVIEKLVDIVHFLHLEIQKEFGTAEESVDSHCRLGPAGLSLHYANMIIQIDTLVARSSNMPQNTRESLYQGLPPALKSSFRSKLKSFHVKEEMTIKEIKDEMEKTLGWLVPVATNTAKAHHGFGWVGEWANTGSDGSRKANPPAEIMRIETLHHADKDKTESCVLEMLLWLHYLATQSKSINIINNTETKNLTLKASQKKDINIAARVALPLLTTEDCEILSAASSKKKRGSRISRSVDFDRNGTRPRIGPGYFVRSRSYSPPRERREILAISRVTSGIRIPGFGVQMGKVLDAIDRVEMRG